MLELKDLKVGMKVDIRELDNTCEKVIIIGDFVERYVGYVLYIGEDDTDELYDICSNALKNGLGYYKHMNMLEEVSVDE